MSSTERQELQHTSTISVPKEIPSTEWYLMALNRPKGPEQDIVIEIEHSHTEKKCTIPSENKTLIKILRRRKKLSAWFHQQAALRGLNILPPPSHFLQKGLSEGAFPLIWTSGLLHLAPGPIWTVETPLKTLSQVFSAWSFFSLFHKLLCKQERFLINSCVYLPFSESNYLWVT